MGGGSPASVPSQDLFAVATVGLFLTFTFVSTPLAGARTPTPMVVFL